MQLKSATRLHDFYLRVFFNGKVFKSAINVAECFESQLSLFKIDFLKEY